MRSTNLIALTGLASVILATANSANALTVTPTFDISITSAANAAAIEAEIRTADAFYSNFSNPETVNVYYRINATAGAVASSNTQAYVYSFANTYKMLAANGAANPSNSVINTAAKHFAVDYHGTIGQNVFISTADARALGDTGALPALFIGSGAYDGEVNLGTSINYGPTPVAAKYAGLQAIEHETNEILGIGGTGSGLNDGTSADAGILDLYRFSAAGVFTHSLTGPAYFSVDGGITNIASFNQQSTGDRGDWLTPASSSLPAFIQDAAFYAGANFVSLTNASPEVKALQAVGYNFNARTAVAEPATWALITIGMFGIGAAARRRTALAV